MRVEAGFSVSSPTSFFVFFCLFLLRYVVCTYLTGSVSLRVVCAGVPGEDKGKARSSFLVFFATGRAQSLLRCLDIHP